MSQGIKKEKKKCPYCSKKKSNLDNHIRLAHPEAGLPAPVPPDASVQPVQPPPPALYVKKLSVIKWKLLIPGMVCVAIGIGGLILYAASQNILTGFLAIAGLVPGGFLIYYAFNRKESGYIFAGAGKAYTGKENSIVIRAIYNPQTKKAVPDRIDFETISPALPGARPHLLRNLSKHFYEYMNIVGEGQTGEILIPVTLPDKKLCTPEAFCIPSNMPRTREYMEYNPPTAFQKIASGVLVLVMVIVGVLMVMTTSNSPATVPVPKAMTQNTELIQGEVLI